MKIAAFNIRRFGIKKCTNEEVFSIITKIVARYDIIVILEVFDSKEKAAKLLTAQLNSSGKGCNYKYILSKPLGRGDYKEQYLFIYREDVVQVKEIYQYEDQQEGDADAFAREPFVVRFESKKTAVRDFVLIPVHTTPKDSVKEIDELYDVFLAVKEKWKMQRVILLGDFNADGAYVSNKKMKTIRLRQDTSFHWLICDEKDTTASNTTDCSYDRMVVHDDMYDGIVPNSAKPFNFQKEYKLTDEETLAVSDHYPVELALKPRRRKKMVVHDDMQDGIVLNSAKPFNFQEEYKLTDEETLAVSDHYPVELALKPQQGTKMVVHDDMYDGIVLNSAKPFKFQEEYKLTDEETLAVSDHYPVELALKPQQGKK